MRLKRYVRNVLFPRFRKQFPTMESNSTANARAVGIARQKWCKKIAESEMHQLPQDAVLAGIRSELVTLLTDEPEAVVKICANVISREKRAELQATSDSEDEREG